MRKLWIPVVFLVLVLVGCGVGAEYKISETFPLVLVKIDRNVQNGDDKFHAAAKGYRFDEESKTAIFQCPCYFSSFEQADRYPAVKIETGELAVKLLPGADYDISVRYADGVKTEMKIPMSEIKEHKKD